MLRLTMAACHGTEDAAAVVQLRPGGQITLASRVSPQEQESRPEDVDPDLTGVWLSTVDRKIASLHAILR